MKAISPDRGLVDCLQGTNHDPKEEIGGGREGQGSAEQDGYDVGVAETEEALRAEVSEVCRRYCLQVWNKAFNQARVKASFTLRRVESVYYPLAILTSSFASTKADIAFEVAEIGKDIPAKPLSLLTVLPSWPSS